MKIISGSILLLIGLSACSKSNLEDEMDAYCTCISAFETTDELNVCLAQLDSLTQHYEYAPESIEYISSRIKSCPVSR